MNVSLMTTYGGDVYISSGVFCSAAFFFLGHADVARARAGSACATAGSSGGGVHST